MEKLCNVLSEIHLRSVVTFSVSTPTTAEYLSTSIGLRNYRISIGCWFKVFPCTFPVCRRTEGWECNFFVPAQHIKSWRFHASINDVKWLRSGIQNVKWNTWNGLLESDERIAQNIETILSTTSENDLCSFSTTRKKKIKFSSIEREKFSGETCKKENSQLFRIIMSTFDVDTLKI